MSSFYNRIFNMNSSSNASSSSRGIRTLMTAEAERQRLEEEEETTPNSQQRHTRRTVSRNSEQAHENLCNDYFVENPRYNATMFRRRFRMRRELFIRIKDAVELHEPFFQQRRNSAGRMGLSSLTKITAVLRILAYGIPADQVDEYLKIGETTTINSLKAFCKAVISIFGAVYLRRPNHQDVARLLHVGESRGFPGMLGSIDCMHWEWKNCPRAWHGQYQGHIQEPTIILECIASYDLWIWHAFFGLPGSLNDINVLDRSPVFDDLAQGRAPLAAYSINGRDYTMGYYLADGIYPPWATFVKTLRLPISEKAKYFKKCQEAARKDVERAFGVLQARFAIVAGPVRYMSQDTLSDVMLACVIMHNMIVEDERHLYLNADRMGYDLHPSSPFVPSVSHAPTVDLQRFMETHRNIRDKNIHNQLQNDLIEHLWNRRGAMEE